MSSNDKAICDTDNNDSCASKLNDEYEMEAMLTSSKSKTLFNEHTMNINDTPEEITECPLCGSFIRTKLELHFQSDHREYDCPFCGVLFDEEAILISHINREHSDGCETQSLDCNQVFVCPICRISSSDQHILAQHVETHFSETSSHIENTINRQCVQLTDSTNSLVVNIDDNYGVEQILSEFENGNTNDSGKLFIRVT